MLKHTLLVCLSVLLVAAAPRPVPEAPGLRFQLPDRPTASAAPLIYEHSGEAAPDETFFLVGENLTTNIAAWGVSADNPGGKELKPRVQFLTGGYLAATLPERAQDGPFLVWVKNSAGWSQPIVLNTPQPWWCGPDAAVPGDEVRVFGRNLARRPDFARAFVYLCQPGQTGVWADEVVAGKHAVQFRVPAKLAAGEYEVWLHAGAGGEWGWGGPVGLRVVTEKPRSTLVPGVLADTLVTPRRQFLPRHLTPVSPATGQELQQMLDDLAAKGGGTLKLGPGTISLNTTLRIPAQVRLEGATDVATRTTLQLTHDPTARFPRLAGSGWSQAPGGIHTPGDTIDYQIEVPKPGEWSVWLRYATDMAPWKQPGVSGNHTLAADDTAPVALMNLTNTGGFGTFQWVRAASLHLTAGRHKLTWKNAKGGGIALDAFLFALDPGFKPSQGLPPPIREDIVVLQGEDCVRFAAKDGTLPGGDRAAVWLTGDGAGLAALTIHGNALVNLGVAIRSPQPGAWLTNCHVEHIRISDCDGKQGENCGIHVRYADHAFVRNNEISGRSPLFISGARRSMFTSNLLTSVTRFGGNAEAAILGRNETIEECVFEGNRIASPPGALAGGPTARRLLWFSTGHGSITRNWIANNGVEQPNGPGANLGAGQARFGGVAGTDQNVGEMILFEGHHRTMFFGRITDADAQSITLPKIVPATPDDRLGSVARKQLAHDAAGNETPFWPPDVDDGSDEPPINEYYVSIMAGRGQGQTRRVLRRAAEKLVLDRPWNVPPTNGCVVAVGTAFYQNHIVGNYVPDGMTGIQLWISCMENIVAGNTIARQRKPGLFLYANGTTLASSMPRTWNRGISPLFWNLAEGNRTEECSAGALVTSGDSPTLPVEFPRALGNVLRHNSFVRSRTDGVVINGRKVSVDTSASIVGTIVEFNVVRDAAVAYHAANSCDGVVFRRDHAHFWYPVNTSTNAPVAFQLDDTNTVFALEKNSIEGIHGVHDGKILDLKTPSGARRLAE